MKVHGFERNLSRNIESEHYHARHPEKDYFSGGFHDIRRIERFEIL